MKFYPIFLNLLGRECAVVGGGEVGTRKVEGLLKAGAKIRVISPEATEPIRKWKRQKKLHYLKRRYRKGDLKGFFLAYAATGIPQLDVEIAEEARSEGVLLNVIDRPPLSDFITPALLERGDLTIAISTGGKSPGFARKVKEELERLVGPEYEKVLELVASVRDYLLRQTLGEKERRQLLQKLIESPLIDLMRQRDVAGLEAVLRQVLGRVKSPETNEDNIIFLRETDFE